MGLTKGTRFTLTKKTPLGDPFEIVLFGYKPSLRKNEADTIIIEKITGDLQ